MRIRYSVTAVILAAVLTGALAFGTAAEEAAAEETAEVLMLGEQNEGDYAVKVTNLTGQDITSVKIRVDYAEYGEELLPEGSVFAADEEGLLCCTPKPLEPGATSAPRYDIKLVFADGEVAVIHTFPFGDADSVEFLFDDEPQEEAEDETGDLEAETEEADPDAQTVVAYLKFTSLSQGAEHETLQHERDTLNPPEVDYSAYTDYSSYGGGDYSYSGGSDYSYSEPVYSEPVYSDNGGGDDDPCVADGVLD